MSCVQLGDVSDVNERGAHERMAEVQRLPIEAYEARGDGGIQVGDGHWCAGDDLGRLEDLGELPLVLERRDQQQGAGVAWQTLGLRREGAFEPCRDGQVIWQRHAASASAGPEGDRELEDRQRVTPRLVEQSRADDRGEVRMTNLDELSSLGLGERA